MEDNEKQFIKAFNDGYLLSKYEPELLNAILQGDRSNTPYIQAMALGKEQYDKDKEKDKAIDEKAQVKDRYPSWLTGDRLSRSDPESDRDKDKDLDRDIDPER